jgi:hypothetical protein
MKMEHITPNIIRATIQNHVRKFEPDFLLPNAYVTYYIAGGAVANTILYLLGKVDHLIINDVDIFVLNGDHDQACIEMGIDETEAGLKRIAATAGYLGAKSRIEGVARKGYLNIIFSKHNTIEEVIVEFDINCCQVAIHPSWLLFWGRHKAPEPIYTTIYFDKYTEDSQLLSTWSHSAFTTACRMMNKHRDLGGYFNEELELSILAQMYFDEATMPMTEEDFAVPSKYSDYWSLFPQLSKYFTKTEDQERYSAVNQHIGLGTWAKINHYRTALGLNGKFKKRLLKEMVACLSIDPNGSTNYIIDKILTNTDSKQGIPTHEQLKACEELYSHLVVCRTFGIAYNPHEDFFIASLFKKASESMPGIYGVAESVNLDPQLTLLQDLGSLEMFKFIKREYSKQEEVFNKPVGVPIYVFGCEVREITSTLALRIEGQYMHHCVTGYTPQIRSGMSKIFSLIDHQSEERSTLEVSFIVNKTEVKSNWFIRQNKGKRNTLPGEKLRQAGGLIAQWMQDNVAKPSKAELLASRMQFQADPEIMF